MSVDCEYCEQLLDQHIGSSFEHYSGNQFCELYFDWASLAWH